MYDYVVVSVLYVVGGLPSSPSNRFGDSGEKLAQIFRHSRVGQQRTSTELLFLLAKEADLVDFVNRVLVVGQNASPGV